MSIIIDDDYDDTSQLGRNVLFFSEIIQYRVSKELHALNDLTS